MESPFRASAIFAWKLPAPPECLPTGRIAVATVSTAGSAQVICMVYGRQRGMWVCVCV